MRKEGKKAAFVFDFDSPANDAFFGCTGGIFIFHFSFFIIHFGARALDLHLHFVFCILA